MNISTRIRRLTNVFLILFVALSAGLVYWQVLVAKDVADLSNQALNYNRGCTSDAAPVRGKIFDRNGVLLAYSQKVDGQNLCGYKRVYTDASKGLEGLIGYYISPEFMNPDPAHRRPVIEEQFDDYLTGKKGLADLDNTANKVLHVPPQGDDIYLTIDSRIEQILLKNFATEAPTEGSTSVFKTDKGSVIVSDPSTGEILGILSEPGYDANCVVSCSLQLLHDDMLAKGYQKNINCADPCSMDQFKSALDAESARLQAQPVRKGFTSCAQYSDCTLDSTCEQSFDCNELYLRYLNSDPEQPLIFRPTQSCSSPGSTYKTMTLMAALDSGAMTLDDKVFYDDAATNPQHLQAMGPVTIRDTTDPNNVETFQPSISNIQGYTYHFPVNLAYGFSHSDNIIFLQAGVKTGVDNWLKYNNDFYVNQIPPFDLPVRVSTVTPGASLCSTKAQPYDATNHRLTVPALAENAFGQGVDFVTPFQMMLIDNVAADDGKLMQPSIIEKIVEPKTQTVTRQFQPSMLKQVVSQRTSQEVRDAMYGVNLCGSGSLNVVQLSYPFTNWQVIGKTGTAEQPKDPNDPNKFIPANSWYITAAPYIYQSNAIPRITITAMKENGGEGAYANGPMLRDIYNDIFTQIYTDVKVDPMPPGGQNFCFNTGLLQAK